MQIIDAEELTARSTRRPGTRNRHPSTRRVVQNDLRRGDHVGHRERFGFRQVRVGGRRRVLPRIGEEVHVHRAQPEATAEGVAVSGRGSADQCGRSRDAHTRCRSSTEAELRTSVGDRRHIQTTAAQIGERHVEKVATV